MKIGSWNALGLLDGTFLLDGGSMFGIVPRPLWSRRFVPDEQNRIPMALRPLLLRGQGRNILVDCGIGLRFSPKQQEIYQYRRHLGGLSAHLARLGLDPGDITDVIATHLHFDHLGGLLAPGPDGALTPVFPRATVHLQEAAWEWAKHPSPWDQGSFFLGDLAIWSERLDIHLLRGDEVLFPGIRVQRVDGHTPGQQLVFVEDGSESLLYCADLIPTASHLHVPFIMAYDQHPLTTLKEKEAVLGEALLAQRVLVFEHDPFLPACRLVTEKGRFAPGCGICLNTGLGEVAGARASR